MTRRHLRLATASFGLAVFLILGSCTSRLGWGLVLWSAPEGPLPAGSIVPVYIKSNIQKVYVVGVPGLKGKDRNKKVELPFWQVELYSTRGKAAARVKAMGENVSLYMIAAKDGLPLREKPSNGTGVKRVYRLRQGQSVKVLQKVEGEAVSTGSQVLPGAWYEVLTDDGTKGYIYSFALRLYDEAKEGPPVLASAKQALSGRVDLIFSRSWRPEFFQEMLDDSRIDLDYFNLRFGVFVDAIRRQVRIELPAASQVFNYSGVSEAGGLYVFEGTPLKIKIESDTRMTCYWTGEDAVPAAVTPGQAASPVDEGAAQQPADDSASAAVEGYSTTGSSGSASFAVLTSEPREAIRLEALRRQKLLSAFVDSVGGSWASTKDAPGLGLLALTKNGRFSWSGRGEAAVALVPPDSGENGEIAFRLFLDPALAASWSGSFSLRFDQLESGKRPNKWLDFLYRRSPAGLVLAPAAPLPESLIVQDADPRSEPIVFEPAAQ